jgi:hypothetical protein
MFLYSDYELEMAMQHLAAIRAEIEHNHLVRELKNSQQVSTLPAWRKHLGLKLIKLGARLYPNHWPSEN